MAPTYIKELLTVLNKGRALRSNAKHLLVVPKTATVKYGDSAFSHAAPFLWNQLPDECRMATTLSGFKLRLKTFLFKQAFDC